jgi:hypothetical protein
MISSKRTTQRLIVLRQVYLISMIIWRTGSNVKGWKLLCFGLAGDVPKTFESVEALPRIFDLATRPQEHEVYPTIHSLSEVLAQILSTKNANIEKK